MHELPLNRCWACLAPIGDHRVYCEWCARSVPKRERGVVDRMWKRFEATDRSDAGAWRTAASNYHWALRRAAIAIRSAMLGFHIPVEGFGDPAWAQAAT